MNMVGHPAYRQDLMASVLDDSGHVTIEVFSPTFINKGHPVFNSENGLDMDLRVGVWHISSVLIGKYNHIFN